MDKSTGFKTQPKTPTPLFPRKQPFFGSARSGPGRGTRRSEPLTARTDLESSKAREKGILAHHAILGELRGERSEAAKREAPPLSAEDQSKNAILTSKVMMIGP